MITQANKCYKNRDIKRKRREFHGNSQRETLQKTDIIISDRVAQGCTIYTPFEKEEEKVGFSRTRFPLESKVCGSSNGGFSLLLYAWRRDQSLKFWNWISSLLFCTFMLSSRCLLMFFKELLMKVLPKLLMVWLSKLYSFFVCPASLCVCYKR